MASTTPRAKAPAKDARPCILWVIGTPNPFMLRALVQELNTEHDGKVEIQECGEAPRYDRRSDFGDDVVAFNAMKHERKAAADAAAAPVLAAIEGAAMARSHRIVIAYAERALNYNPSKNVWPTVALAVETTDLAVFVKSLDAAIRVETLPASGRGSL